MQQEASHRQPNPAFWTTAERLQEVFSQLERHISVSPTGLARLRQVQALEAELEAEMVHRSRKVYAA